MTATVEPGSAEDWEDTGPIPLYTRPSGDAAKWRDRGRIIADLITERDEARADFGRALALLRAAERERDDLRAKVAAVEALLVQWPRDRATYPKWERYAYTAVKLCEDELRAALASVGRTEPAPEAGGA